MYVYELPVFGVYMIDLEREICKPVLKLEILSEFGLSSKMEVLSSSIYFSCDKPEFRVALIFLN